MTPTAALALCRGVQDTAALVLWGAAAYLAWLVPSCLARSMAEPLQRWHLALVMAAAAATLAMLPIESAVIGEGWQDAVSPALLAAVLSDTGAGHAWMVQVFAGALLVEFASLGPLWFRLSGTAAAAGLMLGSFCLTGHAAAHSGWPGLLHQVNDATHVLAAGAWLGALVPVLLILPKLADPETRPAAAVALRRFSRAGHVVVALVLLTGVINATLVLDRWPTDFHSPYEALLDTKMLAVAGMVGLALVNRYLLVPRLGNSPGLTLRWLHLATLAEVPLGLLAIGLVAVFGLFDPG